MPQVDPSSKASIFPRTHFIVSTTPTEITAKSVSHILYAPSVSSHADEVYPSLGSPMQERAERLGNEVITSVNTFMSSNTINCEHYARPTEEESCRMMEDLVRTYAKKAETEKVGTVDWSIKSRDLTERHIARVPGEDASEGAEEEEE